MTTIKAILSSLTANLITTKLTPIKTDDALADTKSKSVRADTAKPSPAVLYAADEISISKDGIGGIAKSAARDEMEGLLKGKALTDQANASLQKIQTYMGALKNNIAVMADANLSADARTQYQLQYQAIVDEISAEIKHGGNLLSSTNGIQIPINGGQGTINVPGAPLYDTIQANLGTVPQTAEASINMLLGGFSTSITAVGSAAMDMGIANGRINDQIAFLKAKAAAVTPPEVKETEIKAGMTQEGADAKSAVKVAITGADQITLALGKLRSVASILADENLAQNARADYQRLYTSLRQETFDFLQGSNDSGFNFLTSQQSISIAYDKSGNKVNMPGFDLSAQLDKLLPAQINSANDLSTFFGNINQVTQQVSNAQNQLQEILKIFGTAGRR